jgi:protein disulfide-isomerase A1
MRALGLVFLALIAFTVCDDDFPLEKDVIILTDSTFDKAVEKYEYLLVLFYAPWCGHCKKFHPEYEKAATTLRKENLYLAKVDATAEKKLAEKFEIQGFPTVKLFIKGQPIEYTGGRKESEVVNWMRKKTGPATKSLKTVEEVEKFQKDNDVVLVYFGDNKADIEEFTRVARKNEDFPFAVVEAQDVIKKFAKAGTVVLFKNFDEKKRELTEVKEKAIDEFIDKYSSPKVMKFDEKAAQIIFGKSLPAIMLYASEKSDKWSEYQKLMTSVSEKLGGKLKVVLTDIKEGMAARLAEYIGIKENELPSVRIADTRGDFKKYNMEGEINEKNILKFVEDWENKKLKPHLKTAEEPKENNGDVFVVVGKTFQKEVIDNDKDVMLLFYAPWCGHCKALHPKYEEVAKKLKEKNPKLRLAKIDATENEVESVSISGFPTVKFYPGNKKDKAPLDYNGDRSVDDIIKFIKANAATKIIYEEEKKEEKKDEKKEAKKEDGKTEEL